MTSLAAPLGILAFFNMAAATCCSVMPEGPTICYGGREVPRKAPEQPGGCHAVLGCAAHKRAKANV